MGDITTSLTLPQLLDVAKSVADVVIYMADGVIEEMGYDRFNDQLSQRSDYYAEEFRNETIPEEEE